MREMMNCKELTTNQIIKPVFDDVDVDELEKSRQNYESLKKILAGNISFDLCEPHLVFILKVEVVIIKFQDIV